MLYKVGDKIEKYTVTRDLSTANAGQCEWGFASYNGIEYFIKRFLQPVYQGKDARGSEKNKEEKRKRCQAFESRHQAIEEALSHLGEGGLVVKPVEFFKYGKNPNKAEHYFKVCHKINTNYITEDIHKLSLEKRLFVMLTATLAVSFLHQEQIIHFDLKPDNILIHQYGEKPVAKLIDFDDSIIAGGLITPDEIVSDSTYHSPELAQYIETNGESPIPDFKSDIFSLGLVFSEYWTGKLPNFSSDFAYAYQAILHGNKLLLSPPKSKKKSRIKSSVRLKKSLSPEEEVIQLIENMLVSKPEKRPTSKEVHNCLKTISDKITTRL